MKWRSYSIEKHMVGFYKCTICGKIGKEHDFIYSVSFSNEEESETVRRIFGVESYELEICQDCTEGLGYPNGAATQWLGKQRVRHASILKGKFNNIKARKMAGINVVIIGGKPKDNRIH